MFGNPLNHPQEHGLRSGSCEWTLKNENAKYGCEYFGGQTDFRLIHQLYMEDTALAIVVFDGQTEDLFEELEQWDRDLTRAARRPFSKLLVAARVDTGALRIKKSAIESFAKDHGYLQFIETSALTGEGITELQQAIIAGIRWDDVPWTSSPRLFKRIKDEILQLKDTGRVLMQFKQISELLHLTLAVAGVTFSDAELKAVIGLLAASGLLSELEFGSYVLLRPEQISAYAQSVIRTLRQDEFERGCVLEEKVLNGDLVYDPSISALTPRR